MREALARFRGPVVYVANVMTQPEETAGLTVADHVRALADHAGTPISDVLVPAERLPSVARHYGARGAAPVEVDESALARLGVRVRRMRLLSMCVGPTVRHDPARLADAVLAVAGEARRGAPLVSARAR
jgi:2-phospho-L-lactate transferase/gluconeogenesis factor (CofD/UPF0052 family)